MQCRWLFAAVLLAALVAPHGPTSAFGQAQQVDDERAIRAAAKQYLDALARGDAKLLAELWTADGDYIDARGFSHPANELIVEAARSAGAGERPKVKLVDSRIRFLTDDVAIEDGVSEVAHPGDGPPSRGRFSVIWVKQAGRWRLASLREVHVERAEQPARLRDLAWMLGEWTAASGDTTLEVTARWNATETFLLRDLAVNRDGKVVFRVAQRIGWDPLAHTLKSWVFDSDGGYGSGTWSKQGDSWLVETEGVLPDGRPNSAIHRLTRTGADAFTWTSTGRKVDGQTNADAQLRFTRKSAKE